MPKYVCQNCGGKVTFLEDAAGQRRACPHCKEAVTWGPAEDASRPAPNPPPLPKRDPGKQDAELPMDVEKAKGGAVLVIVAILVGCWYWNSGGVMCYPVAYNGWTFECELGEITGAKFDEQFPPNLIAVAERQGQDLTRTFRGTRWLAVVKVESGKGPVQKGGVYKMYGTVESVYGNRVNFRDCKFVPN